MSSKQSFVTGFNVCILQRGGQGFVKRKSAAQGDETGCGGAVMRY